MPPIIDEGEDTQGQDQSQGLSDEEMDNLINGGDDYQSREIPDAAPEQAPADPFADFKLKVGDKEIVPKDIDQVKQWAQQGYNYAQHMNQFNSQKAEFDQKYKHYADLDSFAQQNPEWWEHVNNSFQQQNGGQQAQENGKNALEKTSNSIDNKDNISEKVEQVIQERFGDQFKQFQDFLSLQEQERQRAEDAAIDSEIQTIKEQNPDLDWTNLDENGKSLEFKILEHANQNGIPNFKTAFRDFYHDKLLHKVEMRGYEKAKQELLKNKKLGLLGETPAPLKSFETEKSIKDQSWDDIENDILKEYGLGD